MANINILSLVSIITYSLAWSADNINKNIADFNKETKNISQYNKYISWKMSEALSSSDFTKRITDQRESIFRQKFFSYLTAAQDSVLNTQKHIEKGTDLLKQYQDNSNANDLPAHVDLAKSRIDALKKWNDDLSDLYLGVLQRTDIQSVLVPNSIDPSRSWNLLESKITTSSADLSVKVRRKEAFFPANVLDPSKKTLFIVTHGTFGKLTSSFIDDFEPQTQNYRHIKRFASWYADMHKTNLDLVSFKWTGELFDTPRFNAAGELNKYVNKHYPNIPLVLMAHSHGCNIHNKFSQITKNPIELMIHLACPKREPHEEPDYDPQNFKQLVYFHTKNDAIEPLGRLDKYKVGIALGTVGIGALAIKFNKDIIKDLLIKQADFQAQLTDSDRLLAKTNPVEFLDKHQDKVNEMMNAVKNYQFYLKTGIFGSGLGSILAAQKVVPTLKKYNSFEPRNSTSVIGLKTKINDENLGHSTVIDVVKYLPELFVKIGDQNLDAASKSFTANLHAFDPQRDKAFGKNGQLDLQLSNIKVANNHTLPEKMPLFPQYKKSISDID